MPKIIENIEDKIFLAAQKLFYEKGYEKVNMKEISKEAEIGVGTLYNYYSNKNDLYFSVLRKSWNKTFKKLDNVLEKDLDAKEKLEETLTIIYDEIVGRKCMGIQIRKIESLKGEEFIKLEKHIKKNIKKIFEEIKIKDEFSEDENILGKLVYSILINITMLIDFYPQTREDNIKYIYNSLLSFIA